MAEEQLYAWLLISFLTRAGGLPWLSSLRLRRLAALFFGVGVGHYTLIILPFRGCPRYLVLYLFIISFLSVPICICSCPVLRDTQIKIQTQVTNLTTSLPPALCSSSTSDFQLKRSIVPADSATPLTSPEAFTTTTTSSGPLGVLYQNLRLSVSDSSCLGHVRKTTTK